MYGTPVPLRHQKLSSRSRGPLSWAPRHRCKPPRKQVPIRQIPFKQVRAHTRSPREIHWGTLQSQANGKQDAVGKPPQCQPRQQPGGARASMGGTCPASDYGRSLTRFFVVVGLLHMRLCGVHDPLAPHQQCFTLLWTYIENTARLCGRCSRLSRYCRLRPEPAAMRTS